MLRLFAATAALLFAVPAAAQQVEGLRGAQVVPIMEGGTQGGCNLVFAVGHGPREDDWTTELGGALITLFSNDAEPMLGMELTYVTDGDVLARPAKAWLITPGGTNQEDFTGSEPSDRRGFQRFAYRYGPESQVAVERLANGGTVRIGIELADGTSSEWTIDLTKEGTQLEWVHCLGEMHFPILD